MAISISSKLREGVRNVWRTDARSSTTSKPRVYVFPPDAPPQMGRVTLGFEADDRVFSLVMGRHEAAMLYRSMHVSPRMQDIRELAMELEAGDRT